MIDRHVAATLAKQIAESIYHVMAKGANDERPRPFALAAVAMSADDLKLRQKNGLMEIVEGFNLTLPNTTLGSFRFGMPARAQLPTQLPAAAAVPTDWSARLAKKAMFAPMTCSAIIGKINMSLGEFLALTQGMTIPIVGASTDKTLLVVGPPNAVHSVGTGTLGEWRGRRAVRIADDS